MEDLLKVAEKWQLAGIVGVGALAFLFLAFFAGFPAPGNGWSPALRGVPHYGLLGIGAGLLAGAAILAMLARPRSKASAFEKSTLEKPGIDPVSPAMDPAPTVEPTHTGESTYVIEPASGDAQQHPIVVKFYQLPRTQKELVVFFYEHSHLKRVPMNKFYKAVLSRHGSEFLSSDAECFYRLKTLAFEGFLELASVGQKETDMVKLDDVRRALSDAEIVSKTL